MRVLTFPNTACLGRRIKTNKFLPTFQLSATGNSSDVQDFFEFGPIPLGRWARDANLFGLKNIIDIFAWQNSTNELPKEFNVCDSRDK
jgi:hypothetical protein